MAVMARHFLVLLVAALAALLGFGGPGGAQEPTFGLDQGTLRLSATLVGSDAPLTGGLRWRVFAARPDADGVHALIVESGEPQPTLTAPPGDYVVHVSLGLASAAKRVSLGQETRDERLILNAGALRVTGTLGGAPIDPAKLSIDIYALRTQQPRRPSSSTPRRAPATSSACRKAPTISSRPSSTRSGSARSASARRRGARQRADADQFDRRGRHQGRRRQADRRDPAPPLRDGDDQARQRARRRSARQQQFHRADAGRRPHPRPDRRLPVAGARRRRIRRHRPPRIEDLPGDLRGAIGYGPRRGSCCTRGRETRGRQAESAPPEGAKPEGASQD